jgi:hypothetical protein
MRVVLDGGEYRQPLFGHPAAVGTQGGCPGFLLRRMNCHESIEALILS